jgi:hypothetical protein
MPVTPPNFAPCGQPRRQAGAQPGAQATRAARVTRVCLYRHLALIMILALNVVWLVAGTAAAKAGTADPGAADARAGAARASTPALQGLGSHLDRRIAQQTDELTRAAAGSQMATLESSDVVRGTSQRVAAIVETRLVALDDAHRRQLLADALGESSDAAALAEAQAPARNGRHNKDRDGRHNEDRDGGRNDGRMESGSLEVDPASAGDDPAGSTARARHLFDRPFAEAPRVAVGMRARDEASTALPQVTLRVVGVDASGFDYEIRSSGDAPTTSLTADWVAFASGRRTETEVSLR